MVRKPAKKARTLSRPSLVVGRVCSLLCRAACHRRWFEWTDISEVKVPRHCKQRKHRESWAHALLRHPDRAATTFELPRHRRLRFSVLALDQYGVDPEAFRAAASGMHLAVVYAAWLLLHVGSVHVTASYQLPASGSEPAQTFAEQIAEFLAALGAEWRDSGAIPAPGMLQPEVVDEEEEEGTEEAEEQQGSAAQGAYRLDASVTPEVLPGVPQARPALATWLKAQLGLPSRYKVKETVLDKIPEEAPLAEVLERAVRRIAFTYRRGFRFCEEMLPPNLPLADVRRRLGVRRGDAAGGKLAKLVQKSGATLVGLLVPGLRHPRPHVLVGPSTDPKLVQALYNWSRLEFDPEEALAFYCGFLLKEKAEGEEAGDYQLEAQPGALVGTFTQSVWVCGDRPPQLAARQREEFSGKVLMDRRHWQWPGAFAHIANDSLQADKANLTVHENLVMTVLPDCPFPCFAEGLWWYGPDYWSH